MPDPVADTATETPVTVTPDPLAPDPAATTTEAPDTADTSEAARETAAPRCPPFCFRDPFVAQPDDCIGQCRTGSAGCRSRRRGTSGPAVPVAAEMARQSPNRSRHRRPSLRLSRSPTWLKILRPSPGRRALGCWRLPGPDLPCAAAVAAAKARSLRRGNGHWIMSTSRRAGDGRARAGLCPRSGSDARPGASRPPRPRYQQDSTSRGSGGTCRRPIVVRRPTTPRCR